MPASGNCPLREHLAIYLQTPNRQLTRLHHHPLKGNLTIQSVEGTTLVMIFPPKSGSIIVLQKRNHEGALLLATKHLVKRDSLRALLGIF